MVEEITQYKKKELINGKEFTYVFKESMHQIQEGWLIDGKGVEQEFFLQQKVQAQYQELVERENRERERQERELKVRRRSRCEIAKKCLTQSLNEVERIVQCMKDYTLLDFVEFSTDTFENSKLYNSFFEDFIPEVRTIIAQTPEEVNEEKLQNLLHDMEQYQEKLHRFFQAALSRAINCSDDTKLLKRLFELVS